jgi:hypothetical protein
MKDGGGVDPNRDDGGGTASPELRLPSSCRHKCKKDAMGTSAMHVRAWQAIAYQPSCTVSCMRAAT